MMAALTTNMVSKKFLWGEIPAYSKSSVQSLIHTIFLDVWCPKKGLKNKGYSNVTDYVVPMSITPSSTPGPSPNVPWENEPEITNASDRGWVTFWKFFWLGTWCISQIDALGMYINHWKEASSLWIFIKKRSDKYSLKQAKRTPETCRNNTKPNKPPRLAVNIEVTNQPFPCLTSLLAFFIVLATLIKTLTNVWFVL